MTSIFILGQHFSHSQQDLGNGTHTKKVANFIPTPEPVVHICQLM